MKQKSEVKPLLCPACGRVTLGPVGSLEAKRIAWTCENGHEWKVKSMEVK